MYGNSNGARNDKGPICNIREKRAVVFKTMLVLAAVTASAVCVSVLIRAPAASTKPLETQQQTVIHEKKTETAYENPGNSSTMNSQSAGTADSRDPDPVKRLMKACHRNCGITCIKGVCTVERIYPGTDVKKKIFYNTAGKPERMEYCLKKDRYDMCSRGGTAYYNTDGKLSVLMKCLSYDINGICLRTDNAINYFYDEKGNNVLRKFCPDRECSVPKYLANAYDEHGHATVQDIPCKNYENGKCGSFGQGNIFEYAVSGRKISARKCNLFNIDLSCAEYSVSTGQNWKYNEDGNNIYHDKCAEVNAKTGICTAVEYAMYYEYGPGNRTESAVYCVKPDENGNCGKKTEFTYSYEYNDKGELSKITEYIIQPGNGAAGNIKKTNSLQMFYKISDSSGHITHTKKDVCNKPDDKGNCISPWISEETYFDENDRILSRKAYTSLSGNYVGIPDIVMIYDDNGELTDATR